MPKVRKTHQDWMSHLCGVCIRKEKDLVNINDDILRLIRQHHHGQYDLSLMPTVACKGCVRALRAKDSGPESGYNLPIKQYHLLKLPVATRLQSEDCQCGFCCICRMSMNEYKAHCQKMRAPQGRPKNKENEEPSTPTPTVICSTCKGEYGRGKPHCCNKTSRNNNVVAGVRELSPQSRGQVAAKILNELRTSDVGKKGDQLDLPSGSKTLHVEFGKKTPEKPFTHEDMMKLKVQKNLPDETCKAIGAAMRTVKGRKSVQPGMREAMAKKKFELEEFFTVEIVDMTVKKGGQVTSIQVPMLYSNDVPGLLKYVFGERDLDPATVVITLGLDDGQGSLKYMITIKGPELEERSGKRALYSDGVAPKQAKLSSVKKAMMLGFVPDVQENFFNVKTLIQKIDLTGLNVSFSVDIKMALYLIGKQSAGCKFNCIYCTCKAPWTEPGKLLTLGDLNNFLHDYIAGGQKDAMEFNNVVHQNLLQPPHDDSTLVLDVVNIPSLHILLGVTTKLLSHIVSCFGEEDNDKVRGKQFYDKFLKSINVTEKLPGRLEGNQCEKVLDNTRTLLRMAKNLHSSIAVKVMPVVNVMDAFSEVKSSCFGERLKGDWSGTIDKFSALYRDLDGISVPPKTHILEVHVKQYLARKQQKGFTEHGLGFWSEQSFESVHHDFKELWANRKVGREHEDYKDALWKAFLEWNSLHV